MNQSEKRVKTVVKGNNEWLESEEREAQKKILESHQEPGYVTTNGRDPEFPDLPGSRHPTFPSQVSAGHKRITDILPTVDLGAPRAASARPARSTCAEPTGPARRCGTTAAGGHFLLLPARLPLFAWFSSVTPPPSPARSQEPKKSPSGAKKDAQLFLVKKDFIGAPGPPRPLPGADPRPRPRARLARPPSRRLGSRAPLTDSRGGGSSDYAQLPSAAGTRGDEFHCCCTAG